jgi:hypothetical protein
MRAYQFLALGRLVIQALEKRQGRQRQEEDRGFPKLARCRADAVSCAATIHDCKNEA